ncbi:hypothetical protein QYZ35_21960, partial [Xanthomonas campestris pv. campestris]|nr:hypothetical protein [Xanthomonas campestris pv. campestris]
CGWLRTAVITAAGCGKFGASPWHVVPALRSVQLASVASRIAASLGKLHLASCGKLDPSGSAGEHGCTIQPLRPLTA